MNETPEYYWNHGFYRWEWNEKFAEAVPEPRGHGGGYYLHNKVLGFAHYQSIRFWHRYPTRIWKKHLAGIYKDGKIAKDKWFVSLQDAKAWVEQEVLVNEEAT